MTQPSLRGPKTLKGAKTWIRVLSWHFAWPPVIMGLKGPESRLVDFNTTVARNTGQLVVPPPAQ